MPDRLPPRGQLDAAAYRQTLGSIADTYHPAVLVVENEETSEVS